MEVQWDWDAKRESKKKQAPTPPTNSLPPSSPARASTPALAHHSGAPYRAGALPGGADHAARE